MARIVYRYVDGKFIEASKIEPSQKVHIISDDMPSLVNHADGNRYDSKSRFRRATRAAGCYEVGSDAKPDGVGRKREHIPEGVRHSIEESINRLTWKN